MTSGGNMKQRLAFYAAVFFFGAACVLAIMTNMTGLALVALALGLICGVGTWTLGLGRSDAEDNTEWMTAIK